MKILVTGANGLLGQHLIKLLLEKEYTVVAIGKGPSRLPFTKSEKYSYNEVDIIDEEVFHEIMFQEKPAIIIHAAAMTQVDECELNEDKSFEVNVQGTIHAIVDAEMYSQFMIYISSDFVFDGQKGNYKEEDEPQPVNWYGYTKTEAEIMVEACEIPWAIVRTCLVYGNSLQGTRDNIVTWVKDKLTKGEKIQVVNDQVRTPTYVEDLAKGILLIVEKRARGIFHISGEQVLTPYDMAVVTANHFGLDRKLIEKVNASTFSQPAKRPARTGFVIDKARKELGYEPITFEEGLGKMFADDFFQTEFDTPVKV